LLPRPPCSTLFPYTTLFRSEPDRRLQHGVVAHQVLALPDAQQEGDGAAELVFQVIEQREVAAPPQLPHVHPSNRKVGFGTNHFRSEEHTSELQSRSDLVCRL